MKGRHTIAIVVPLLNEIGLIAQLAPRLKALDQIEDVDVVIVDGGSDDGGAEALRASGLTVIDSPCGRARQMNSGAAVYAKDTFLFLHADTQLPASAIGTIRAALALGSSWGRFDVRIDGQSRWLKLVGTMMNWRSRLSGIATGDQAIFVTREAFEKVGGYVEQPLMEDIEISKSLKRHGRPACLRETVITSGRRWDERGVWSTIWLMWQLRYAYWRGTNVEELVTRYA